MAPVNSGTDDGASVREFDGCAAARVLSVRVGAVTVRVHSSEALRCYLLAWSRARALAVILDEPEELTVGT